jgi:thioredoxin reductase
MTTEKHCRLLILGSGPAGYTAAVYGCPGQSQTGHRDRHPDGRTTHHYYRGG